MIVVPSCVASIMQSLPRIFIFGFRKDAFIPRALLKLVGVITTILDFRRERPPARWQDMIIPEDHPSLPGRILQATGSGKLHYPLSSTQRPKAMHVS